MKILLLLYLFAASALAQAPHSIGPMTWTWAQAPNSDTPAISGGRRPAMAPAVP